MSFSLICCCRCRFHSWFDFFFIFQFGLVHWWVTSFVQLQLKKWKKRMEFISYLTTISFMIWLFVKATAMISEIEFTILTPQRGFLVWTHSITIPLGFIMSCIRRIESKISNTSDLKLWNYLAFGIKFCIPRLTQGNQFLLLLQRNWTWACFIFPCCLILCCSRSPLVVLGFKLFPCLECYVIPRLL